MADAKTQPKPKANRQYEAMFLLGPGAAADNEGSVTLVRGIIERHGGEVLVLKRWDERKLAYEVHGQKRGTYIIAFFTAPGTSITPIEREVNLSEQVLRVIILEADHLNKEEMAAVEPQPIIREERPSWERNERTDFRDSRDRGPRRDDRPRDDRGPRREEPAGEPAARE